MVCPMPHWVRSAKRGFTLVELLVVIAILAVLIALAAGVGAWVNNEGKRKQTMVAEKMLVEAINGYYAAMTYYPLEDSTTTSSKWTVRLRVALTDPTGAALPSATVRDDLRRILQGMPQRCFRAGDTIFRDGFGNGFRYEKDGAMGGLPLLTSAGADGLFGDESGLSGSAKTKAIEDNVRSDSGGI